MKILVLLLTFNLALSAYSHCGSCGSGDDSAEHSHEEGHEHSEDETSDVESSEADAEEIE